MMFSMLMIIDSGIERRDRPSLIRKDSRFSWNRSDPQAKRRRDSKSYSFVKRFSACFIRCISAVIAFFEEELQNDEIIVNHLIPQSQEPIQVRNTLKSSIIDISNNRFY